MDATGVTITDLARALGRSPNTVARWVRGESLPSNLDVEPLADALDSDPELFFRPPAVPPYPLAKYLRNPVRTRGIAYAVIAASEAARAQSERGD